MRPSKPDTGSSTLELLRTNKALRRRLGLAREALRYAKYALRCFIGAEEEGLLGYGIGGDDLPGSRAAHKELVSNMEPIQRALCLSRCLDITRPIRNALRSIDKETP